MPVIDPDWSSLLEPVARALLDPSRGEPQMRGRELRYGRRGSFSVDCERGTWFDHEAGEGGGVLALVERECGSDRAGAIAWLRERGFLEGSEDRVRDFRPLPAAPAPAPAPSPAAERARTALVAAIWSAGGSACSTPAQGYLKFRGVWSAAAALTPAVLRWLPRSAAPPTSPDARWFGLPRAACGAVVFAWLRAGSVAAVSLEALGLDARVLGERWRRTCGRRAGAVFWARRDAGAGVVHAAEGEIDALAVALLCDGEVMGVGGTSGFVNVAELVGAHRSVVLHADCGRGGERAAVKGLAGLRARGVRARVQWYASDPAAEFEEGA